MHFQFLIEDSSSAILIDTLMQRISSENDGTTYSCKSFKGIGGFPKKPNAKEAKTHKMLNELHKYMKGFDKSLQGFPAAIVVVVDNDDRNTDEFRAELNQIAVENKITVDHVFCIAIEEIEAWLLGDEEAIKAAYPLARLSKLHSYVQDSICGTWEVLAEVVYPGGLKKLRKDCPTYMEIGKCKCEWAGKIGCNMEINRNASPSFRHFISEISSRIRVHGE